MGNILLWHVPLMTSEKSDMRPCRKSVRPAQSHRFAYLKSCFIKKRLGKFFVYCVLASGVGRPSLFSACSGESVAARLACSVSPLRAGLPPGHTEINMKPGFCLAGGMYVFCMTSVGLLHNYVKIMPDQVFGLCALH